MKSKYWKALKKSFFNRRAHLKQCFNELRQVIPTLKGTTRRDSNFSILTSAFKHIQVIKLTNFDLKHFFY